MDQYGWIKGKGLFHGKAPFDFSRIIPEEKSEELLCRLPNMIHNCAGRCVVAGDCKSNRISAESSREKVQIILVTLPCLFLRMFFVFSCVTLNFIGAEYNFIPA